MTGSGVSRPDSVDPDGGRYYETSGREGEGYRDALTKASTICTVQRMLVTF